jgi:hypothetical protein
MTQRGRKRGRQPRHKSKSALEALARSSAAHELTQTHAEELLAHTERQISEIEERMKSLSSIIERGRAAKSVAAELTSLRLKQSQLRDYRALLQRAVAGKK